MKTFKIGNLIFTKKGVFKIAFGFFCTGILLGAFITLSLKNESNFNIPLFLIFNIPIWYFLKPKIKSEITEIKK
jgi:hypothetical protein